MKMLVTNRKVTVSILVIVTLLCGLQGMSYGQTLKASSTQPLTQANLDGSVVTLTLSGGTFSRLSGGMWGGEIWASTLSGLTVSGIPGLTISFKRAPAKVFFNDVEQWGRHDEIERISDTELEVKLAFNGTLSNDAIITFTVEAEAISGYEGPAFTAEIPVTVEAGDSEVAPDASLIYWTDFETKKIQRANLDGSNVQDLITQGLGAPGGIALDVTGGKMYWADWGTDKIQRANLDGSNVQDLVTGLTALYGIALDVAGGKMYWTDFGTDKIQRANLDGSNVQDLVTGLNTPYGIVLDVAGGKMYWTDVNAAKIQRANLDGSNVQDLVTGLGAPRGIALDVVGGKMYWADGDTDKIQRANLDGSNIQDLITQGLETPFDITLDLAGGKMYWTDVNAAKIQRANLDGSNAQDLVTGLRNSRGIALGIPAAQQPAPQPDLVVEAAQAVPATVAPGEIFKLYATLKNQGTTESAATTVRYYRSTDRVITTRDTQLGSARRNPLAPNATIRRYLIVTAPTAPGTYYYGVCVDSVTNESDTSNNCTRAVSLTVTAPTVVSEDVNEDGVVDTEDLVYVSLRYGQKGQNSADVNTDGVVDIDDLILVAAVLDADAAAAPTLNPAALEGLTVAEVKVWLSHARQRDVMDPNVRRGIQFLEQLLASMVPKETLLLANYPNPFNPETWIPYQLSKSAAVMITIYASNGHVIRQLALGHQPAGMYQTRSRAVYWDGKNAVGEPVASGVYFYTLTAGDFSATRKMLIRK